MTSEIYQVFWQNLMEVAPSIFWAGLFLLLGIIISQWIGRLCADFLNKLRLNQLLKRIGAEDALIKIDVHADVAKFFGSLVKWFFIILFLMISSEIVGLSQLSQFFERIINYSYNIFVSFLIFLVAAFLVDACQKIIVGTLERGKITYSRLIGKWISWAIWIFAVLAILYQLKIATPLVLSIFIGMVITLSLALGIALGLGGKEIVSKLLKELEEKLK